MRTAEKIHCISQSHLRNTIRFLAVDRIMNRNTSNKNSSASLSLNMSSNSLSRHSLMGDSNHSLSPVGSSAASRRIRDERQRMVRSRSSTCTNKPGQDRRDSNTTVLSTSSTSTISWNDFAKGSQTSMHVCRRELLTSSATSQRGLHSDPRRRGRRQHPPKSSRSMSSMHQDSIRILQFDASSSSFLSYVEANNVHATSRIKEEEVDGMTLLINESLLIKPHEIEQETTQIAGSSSFHDSFQSSSSSTEASSTATISDDQQQQRSKLGCRAKEKLMAGLQLLATPMIMRKRRGAIVKVDTHKLNATMLQL